MDESTFELTVGRGLCGHVRGYLDKQIFKGLDIRYLESKGWIERDFTIKGNVEHMSVIAVDLKRWVDKLSEDES